MQTRSLRFEAPRSDEASALNDMLARRDQLAATLREAEYAPRLAAEELQRASAEYTTVERRRLSGEDVGDELRAAEKALTKARAKVNEPSNEKAAAARHVVRDMDGQIQRYVVDNYDALAAELAADAEAVASRVDDAMREVIAAHHEREAVAQRVTALASVIRRVTPGEVPWSKAEGVVRLADALLLSGGEPAPAMSTDPRAPRAGRAVAEFTS